MTRMLSLLIAQLRTLVVGCLILAVRAYQLAIRPMLSGACKFHPTCSQYAIEGLQRHGPWRGAALALRRLARCRPFAMGGFDPVPTPKSP